MSCEIILSPAFAPLSRCLRTQLLEACGHHAFSPKWVLVPTSTVAADLRLCLAGSGREQVLAGVRVVPIIGFWRRLAAAAGLAAGRRWSPELDLLLFELVERLPADLVLSRLRQMPSGYRLLRPTFLDLADGGFGPGEREILSELCHEPDLEPIEQETLRLYMAWLEGLGQRGLEWEPLALQQLTERILEVEEQTLRTALACEAGQEPLLWVYGFYDFTDVSAGLLVSLARRLDLTLLYPFAGSLQEPHPAFSFAASVLADLKLRLGSALVSLRELPESPENVRFFLDTFPEGEIPERPSFLSFQRASGARGEALSAAIAIRRWLDAPRPLDPSEIVVVAPDPSAYLASLQEVFSDFCIPLVVLDVPAARAAEQAWKMLCRIWQERAPAEWILAYLRQYPELEVLADVSLDCFESRVRQAGVWGGESWRLLLETDLELEEPERVLVQEILDLWAARPAAGEETFTPGEALTFLRRVVARWLPDPEGARPFLEALERGRRERPELRLGESLLREMLLASVEERPAGSWETPAVRLLPLMRARGVVPGALVFLGLSSSSLPARVREDPLLSDASRERLLLKARQVGHRLPVKSRLSEEMALLFALTNTAAPRVHWVVPQSDERGRALSPTPWVERYLERWAAEQHSTLMLRSPVEQARHLLGLDPSGAFLPPSLLLELESGLEERLPTSVPYAALADLQRRRGGPEYSGRVAGYRPREEGASLIRVTELETLARCPFRYYAARQGWEPLEVLQFREELQPWRWGNLVHQCLEGLFQDLEEDPVSRLSEKGRLESLVDRVLQKRREVAALLPGVFRQLLGERLVGLLSAYLEQLRRGECRVDRVCQLERRMERPFPGLEGWEVSGQMDRVDEAAGSYHIYDYKSGRAPQGKHLQLEIRHGFRLQPALYPWLFAGEDQRQTPSFSYVFLGEQPPRQVDCDSPPSASEILALLAPVLEQGAYLPISNEVMALLGTDKLKPCQFCSFISLCRRFDPGAPVRFLRMAQALLGRRLEVLGGERR